MFEGLTERLNQVFKKLKGRGKLTEKEIKESLREVRLALLEADVNYKVVKGFVSTVETRALGHEVMESLPPAQQVIKIVHDELIQLMDGGKESDLRLGGSPPVAIMLVGLQGSGKTTTAGKLARYLQQRQRMPYLVPADPYRPAAIEQLQKLAETLQMECYAPEAGDEPIQIAGKAQQEARSKGFDVVIYDTAGRLHIDEELMQELKELRALLAPQEVLLVADAMTGQEAVNVAQGFNDALGITGIVLTKLDGDARGGAALSMKSVIEKPIKLVGVGEKLDALEVFHPDRMASRVLGMGDVLSLIEKAQATFDERQAEILEKKLRRDEFTLEDFRDQLRQIRKMGPLEDLMAMIPGVGKLKGMKALRVDEKQLARVEAIINSMTGQERRDYRVLNGSRRLRIARGSGTSVQEVNRLLKQFAMTKKMIRQLNKRGGKGQLSNMFPLS